jgi:hypothetical protein
LVYNPIPELTLRAQYSRSLGGVTLDQSYRLEPTQLAGFPQTFRSLIPESLVGSVAAPRSDVWSAALDAKLKSRTYLGVEASLLESRVNQSIGVFDFHDFMQPLTPSSTQQRLTFREQSFAGTVNQLLGEEWSLGAQYRFSHAQLASSLPAVPSFLLPSSQTEGDLQQVNFYLLYNHPSGFYALGESHLYLQHNRVSSGSLADESFNQINLYAGFRFPRQRADITVGVMNLTASDYHLNPINLYEELPRSRVFFGRVRFSF